MLRVRTLIQAILSAFIMVASRRFMLLYLFREVNLQEGFLFCFVLSSSDRESLHSRLVLKCEKRYTSCMYLYSSNLKCFYINPEREVNAPGGTFK